MKILDPAESDKPLSVAAPAGSWSGIMRGQGMGKRGVFGNRKKRLVLFPLRLSVVPAQFGSGVPRHVRGCACIRPGEWQIEAGKVGAGRMRKGCPALHILHWEGAGRSCLMVGDRGEEMKVFR